MLPLEKELPKKNCVAFVRPVTATDDKQKYRLTGDRLYPLLVELARQAGVEDLD